MPKKFAAVSAAILLTSSKGLLDPPQASHHRTFTTIPRGIGFQPMPLRSLGMTKSGKHITS